LKAAPGIGLPRPLPRIENTLWMRHQGKMSSILRAKPGNSVWTSIGIEWILFCDFICVVHVSKWS